MSYNHQLHYFDLLKFIIDYQNIKFNNMNNKNRKRVVQIDHIREKQEGKKRSNIQGNSQSRSMSKESSDFSDFQMPSKDINKNFVLFQIPSKFKNKDDIKIQEKKRNKQQGVGHIYSKSVKVKSKNQNKIDKNHKQKVQNAQESSQAQNYHTISFNENDQAKKPEQRQNKSNRNKRNQNQQNLQKLITDYDKKQFNDKSSSKKKMKEYSRSQDRLKHTQEQMDEDGSDILKRTGGGICFDVNIKDFVQKSDEGKRKKRRKNKNKQKVSNLNINSNQQILKRRQIAFRYGQLARRRTFGYF